MNFDIQKWALPLFLIGGVIFGLSLFNRWVDHDEAMLGEHAYWYLTKGYYRSVLHEGLPNNWSVIQYSTHKFFVLLGSLAISVLGWSIETLRWVPLFFTALLLWLLNKYSSNFKDVFGSGMSRWVLAILIFQAMFFTAGYRFRPETMLMTMGFLNFMFLERYVKTEKLKFLVLAGMFGGLAMFTHLNGSAYVGAAGLILLTKRKLFPAVAYGFVAALFASLYLHNLLGPGEIQAFLIQYRDNPNLSENDWHWYSPIVKMLSEHLRFFHSPREITTSVLAIFSLAVSWNWIKKEMRLLLTYLLFTILILGALSRQTPIYYLLYLPYLALIIAAHLSRFNELSKLSKIGTVALLIIFLGTQSMYNFELIQRRVDTAARTEQMAAYIPVGSKVLAPLSFLFNGLDEGYEIRSFKAFKFHIRNYNRYADSYEGLVDFLDNSDNDYLILDHIPGNQDAFRDYKDPRSLKVGDNVGSYWVYKVHEDWTLLARNR